MTPQPNGSTEGLTLMTTATNLSQLTGEYVIDGSHSRIGFVARHAMVTKVRGAFNEFDGKISLDGDKPENTTAEVTLKVASIDTRNAQRDGHLATNDFLDAERSEERRVGKECRWRW